MLTETFIASTAGIHKSPSSAAIKDASIFVHEYQPLCVGRASFKKSATPPNCLVASTSHIFAAQADKAVVYVYNREKGNQETLVPFPERIRSLALAADGAILVLGTEGGRIFLWELETCTGRQVTTQTAHLQAVTTIAVDLDSNILLSGSADSNIHVWSLPGILSWSNSGSASQESNTSLRRTLSDHRAGITSLVIGHSVSFLNIAISASKDNSCIVWNYQNGHVLRTILLPSTPLCLALDPADRWFCTGFEDGSIQLVRFYQNPASPGASISNSSQTAYAVIAEENDRWSENEHDLGTTLSMDLSYDGATLLTGHESGQVVGWNIGGGHSPLCDLHGPVTNLHLETPTGFVNGIGEAKYKIHSVTKPRFDLSTTAQGTVPTAYTFTVQFTSELPTHTPDIYESNAQSGKDRFEEALLHPSFPKSLLDSGIAELAALHATSTPQSNSYTLNDHDADFLPLNGDAHPSPNGVDPETSELEEENKELKYKTAALQRVLGKSLDMLEDLREERKWFLGQVREFERVDLERKKRRAARAKRRWDGEMVETDEDDEEIEAENEADGMEVDTSSLEDEENSDDDEESSDEDEENKDQDEENDDEG